MRDCDAFGEGKSLRDTISRMRVGIGRPNAAECSLALEMSPVEGPSRHGDGEPREAYRLGGRTGGPPEDEGRVFVVVGAKPRDHCSCCESTGRKGGLVWSIGDGW